LPALCFCLHLDESGDSVVTSWLFKEVGKRALAKRRLKIADYRVLESKEDYRPKKKDPLPERI